MAKKSTTKSSADKKTTKKSASSKSAADKKKTVKKTAAAKTSTKKTAAAKKSAETKKVTKRKTTDHKTERTKTMAKKKNTTDGKATAPKAEINPAEARAKALAKIKGYSKKDLDHFRELILERRDEILEQLQNLKEQMLDPTTGEYINENSPYSLHMAEQGTDAMEREKTFLYAQRENKFLGYLEEALKRIDAGTYGICVDCIEEPQYLCDTCPLVPKARLEAVPHSQLCLPIKQKQEKR